MSVCIIYIQAKEKELNTMQLPASLKNTKFFFPYIGLYISLLYCRFFSNIRCISYSSVMHERVLCVQTEFVNFLIIGQMSTNFSSRS